jgi:hypothetical protein
MCTTDAGSATGCSAPSISPVSAALTVATAARPRAADPAASAARELATGGEAQDVGAHRLGVGGREVLELDVAVEARADDLELRRAQQARDHRAGQVDALHPVERRTAVGAEEDAAAHLDVVAGDAERVEAPRQPEAAQQEQQHASTATARAG